MNSQLLENSSSFMILRSLVVVHSTIVRDHGTAVHIQGLQQHFWMRGGFVRCGDWQSQLWIVLIASCPGASIQNAPYSFMLMVFSLFFFLFVICPYPWYNILDKTLYSVCKELYLYYSTMNCTNQQYLNIKPTLTIMNPLCPASEVSKMLKHGLLLGNSTILKKQ